MLNISEKRRITWLNKRMLQDKNRKTTQSTFPRRSCRQLASFRSGKGSPAKKAAGEMTAEQLRDIENQEITRIVEKQKEIGLDVVTDGEFRRSWWHYDFLEGLDGVEPFIPAEGIQFHNTKTKARSIKVTGKLDFTSHPALADYQFLHEIAGNATPKLTIPSPNMLFFGEKADKGIYDDQEEYFHDLAQAYKKQSKPSMMLAAVISSSMIRHGLSSLRKKAERLSGRSAAIQKHCQPYLPKQLTMPSQTGLTI